MPDTRDEQRASASSPWTRWLRPWPAPRPPQHRGDGSEHPQFLQPAPEYSQTPDEAFGFGSAAPRPSSSPSSRHDTLPNPDDSLRGAPPAAPGPVLAIPVTAVCLGFGTGLYRAGARASLVFMAENAHRRPDTVQGWYFYNKTKNYRVVLAALRGGLRTGARLGAWAASWVALEQASAVARRGARGGVDNDASNGHIHNHGHSPNASSFFLRGHWIDGAVAGSGVALAAALVNRLSPPIVPRTLALGFLAGGSVGALRDVQATLGARAAADSARTEVSAS